MNTTKHLLYILTLLLVSPCYKANAQRVPAGTFRSPVDGPIRLVANFGELRNNHFHNGLDIRTPSGMKLYAIADGYISRIKISPSSYGNALYVTHANGLVSLYAHCLKFNDTIAKYLREEQYRLQQFDVELYPLKDELKVRKGEVIALSGNTGASQGPHLHFEIREEHTDKTLNPLLYGFDVPDNTTPTIRALYMRALNSVSKINNGTEQIKRTAVVGKAGDFRLASPESIELTGDIGFGLDCFDTQSGSTNPNNVYSIELLIDDKRHCYSVLDTVPFEENRYINSYCDYAYKKKVGGWVQNMYLEKGNKLSVYKKHVNRGVVSFMQDGTHKATIVTKDVNGNKATLEFYFNYKAIPLTLKQQFSPALGALKDCLKENTLVKEGASVTIPAGNMYSDFDFTITKDTARIPVYKILNPSIASHSYYSITIPTTHIPKSLISKALVVCMDYNGNIKSEGGKINANNTITAQSRSFGRFAVRTDEIPPLVFKVGNKGISSKKVGKGKKAKTIVTHYPISSLRYCIGDKLSGIKSYNGYIDGKWELFEYETKSAQLIHFINRKKHETGQHTVKIVVIDYAGNETELLDTFNL
ncbi:MAG: M23 family metallopeptidase [Bacteroidia bacterium]|nr:M23 family metallopeptidase [Bacteroidia bacterium]